MKSRQEIKETRIEIRAKIQHFRHLQSVQFPQGYPKKGTEDDKLEFVEIVKTLKALDIQDNALTYVLNEDSSIIDTTETYERHGRYMNSDDPQEIIPIYAN